MASLKTFTPLVVFTDMDEEFDDKLAAYFISKFGINATIVFMPSSQGTSQDGFNEWKRIMPIWNKLPQLTYISFEDFVKIPHVNCDYVLQISPMAKLANGEFYDGHNLTVNKQYIFGGIYHTKEGDTPSFNKKGSNDILGKFENILIEISSELMASKRPTLGLFNQLPPLFKENMQWTSFKLGLGRMSENHPVANIYAEGLINSSRGRGANYDSVKQLYESVFENEIEQNMVPAFDKIVLDKSQHKKTYQLTKQYIDKIAPKHKDSENNLFRMNIALSILFPGIWNNQEQLISSDKITTDDTHIKKLWLRFKSFKIEKVIKTFNPVYDLFAAYVLLNIIQKNISGSTFTIEDDYENVFDTLVVDYLKKGNTGACLV